ncbi:MAG TPA: hypothetical protein VLV83_17590 [Acidobacteriota bacterium]|nr:hypothetical protein [Acidobacteriota bacterium]
MSTEIRRVDYFYTTVRDQPGEAYRLLSLLKDLGVNLVAVTAVPVGPEHTQMTLFPEDTHKLRSEGKKAGLDMDGPHPALLVQGDDELGALARIHARLFDSRVNVYASTGVADGKGSFGYIIYVRPEEYQRAAEILEV